jgi:hypothetical protein
VQKPDERAVWQSRYAAYALASEADTEQVNKARAAVDTGTYMFSPDQAPALMMQTWSSLASHDVAGSALNYAYVERPFIDLGRRVTSRT